MSAESLTDLPDLGNVDVYLAGGEEFVSSARELLLAGGLPQERLFVDALNRRPAQAPPAD
jgi:hypothetical protein